MNDTATTTVTHSSGKPVPQAPPFILHLCRFFNEVCEGSVKIGMCLLGISAAFAFVVGSATYTLGRVVLHVLSDLFEIGGSGFDAAMNTGVGTLALIILAAIPIGFVYIFLSIFSDLWKKTGRSQ